MQAPFIGEGRENGHLPAAHVRLYRAGMNEQATVMANIAKLLTYAADHKDSNWPKNKKALTKLAIQARRHFHRPA